MGCLESRITGSRSKKSHNKAINADSKKRRSFLALLLLPVMAGVSLDTEAFVAAEALHNCFTFREY
jgi:hypothetical protein